MSKSLDSAPVADAPVQEPQIPLSLDEFCQRLSATSRRVALIGGFHAWAKAQGLVKDVETTFQAAWNRFISLPA
jgi:hypothetical protein